MKPQPFLPLLLFLLPLIGNGQSNTIGLRLGFSEHSYNINEPGPFSLPINNSREVSYSLTAFGRSSLSESDRFFAGYGLGVLDETLFLQPFTPFGAIRTLQDLNADSLIVASLDSRSLQFTVPLELSVKLWDPIGGNWFGRLSGVRMVGGIEGRFIFSRVWMNNTVFAEYDETTQRGTAMVDEWINFRVNHYYSGRMRQVKVLANLGVEFFRDYGPIDVHTGIRFNKYVVSPARFNISNEINMLAYLGMEYGF